MPDNWKKDSNCSVKGVKVIVRITEECLFIVVGKVYDWILIEHVKRSVNPYR